MSQLPEGSYKPLNDINESALGWEVPVESVPLPSGGMLYSPDSFFYNKSLIQIKAMTAKEEDILSSQAYSKDGSSIDHLIASCTGAPLKDIKRLLLGDRNALLISIRVTGYGADYNAEVNCTACGKSSQYEFNLSELEIKQLDVEPVEPGKNIFQFKLPVSKKVVYFKFFNTNDENQIDSEISNMSKMLGEASTGRVTSRLFKRIVSIDGVTDRNQIKKFIDIMPAYDSKKLRSYISDLEPKIITEVHYKCKHCGNETMIPLPIGRNFFWPA
tara:strand:- start:76 stop:891 length:816 start_codon:yes stop_codon:yes gene_type:complete